MRKQLVLLNAALFLLLGGAAFAQDAVEIKFGKGITVKDKDDEFNLNLSGLVHFRWTYEDFDSASGKENKSSFAVERARLTVKGHAFKVWKYQVQADFGKSSAALKEGYIEWAKHRQANIRLGQGKIGFDRSQLLSSSRQMLVDRSLAAREFGMEYDVGAVLHGHAAEKKVQYNFGVFAGEGEGSGGSAKPQHEDGHMFVARLSLHPNGDFDLSESDIQKSDRFLWFVDAAAAVNQDLLSTGTTTSGGGAGLYISAKAVSETDDTRYVAGAGCRYRGLYVSGEYYKRNREAETVTTNYGSTGAVTGVVNSMTDISSDGFYAQAGYMLVPEKWEAAARYSLVDPNSNVDENDQTEVMLGVNRFLRKMGHGLKISADIAQLKDEATDYTDLRGRLQLQVVF